ncbi:MAG: hypothetical protein JXR70_18595 [Spirochaetales bacterium]|nr:hypothetical protein [Spirochaetales bacterium]
MKKIIYWLLFILTGTASLYAQPLISALSPSSGFVGMGVTITGSGFSPAGNIISFTDQSKSMIYRAKIKAESSDGISLKFSVPEYLPAYCGEDNPPCPAIDMPVQPGAFYYVSVMDSQGQESNSLAFTVKPNCTCSLNISGTVTDQTGKPLSGLFIYILSQQAAVTDADGKYSFVMSGTANITGCPAGDTYIFVKSENKTLASRFIPVSCGNPVYNFTVEADSQSPILKGDFNSDGVVNIIDALLIAQYYVGDPGTIIEIAFLDVDVNCDGYVNIIDALMVAQYYVGLLGPLFC